MNIVLGKENIEHIGETYIALELDRFLFSGADQTISAYCILEKIPLEEMLVLANLRDLHDNLIQNYRKRDWNYCLQAIDYLEGRWNGHLDSFYADLRQRVEKYMICQLADDWDGTIIKDVTQS
jgi:hypothetical protein